MRLKLASRKSDLARWQAVQVARALEQLHEKPAVEYLFKASMGDQDLDTPLSAMGAKGVFTEDFYQDLLLGTCDLVVHSWKDLPVEERAETHIAMTLPRADVRDLLLVTEAAWAQAVHSGELQVLTSSPRRVYNLSAHLGELLPAKVRLNFVGVRGNVPTRLRKMREQNAALILAKAGIDRLLHAESEGFFSSEVSIRDLLRECRFLVLPVSLNPGAPAQGALAVETLRAESWLNTQCQRLNDEKTFLCVRREREVLRSYGGGCQQKIGMTVLARDYGLVISLRGLTDRGEVLHQWKIENPIPWHKAATEDAVFPTEPRDNLWFDRQPLPVTGDLASLPALQIARAEVLPETFTSSPGQLIWTAGTQTWRRLCARGIWVNGSFDGLGEQETPGLEHLCGPAPVRWSKLSHARGQHTPGTDLLPTYQLVPRKTQPDLAGKTHFYWLSSTSFERARQLFPEVINKGYNACGPGSTYEHLRRVPGLKHPVKVFVGLEQFLTESLP